MRITIGDLVAILGIIIATIGFTSGASPRTFPCIIIGGLLYFFGIMQRAGGDQRPFFG